MCVCARARARTHARACVRRRASACVRASHTRSCTRARAHTQRDLVADSLQQQHEQNTRKASEHLSFLQQQWEDRRSLAALNPPTLPSLSTLTPSSISLHSLFSATATPAAAAGDTQTDGDHLGTAAQARGGSTSQDMSGASIGGPFDFSDPGPPPETSRSIFSTAGWLAALPTMPVVPAFTNSSADIPSASDGTLLGL